MDAVSQVPPPVNEPVRTYAAGSAERRRLEQRLADLAGAEPAELPAVIGGRRRRPGGEPFRVAMPSDHHHVLGHCAQATRQDTSDAIDAATTAAHDWAGMDFDARAAIFLRAAELLSGPWRDSLNAATMLG